MEKTTRRIILDLAEEYLNSSDYKPWFISGRWCDRITKELKLKELSDLELSNMWDMVFLTLDNKFNYYYINGDEDKGIDWLDVKSAFTEVVNAEARRRKYSKKDILKEI